MGGGLGVVREKENHYNSVQTRCIVKTSGYTRGVCKCRRFYSIQEFSCGIPGDTGDPEKIKNLQKIARKVDFSEPRLLQCT